MSCFRPTSNRLSRIPVLLLLGALSAPGLAQELGWFDGDPLNLHRESPVEQSQRMADWLGGVDRMMERARVAMANSDALGAAQLAQHVIRLRPDDPKPKLLMADALTALGEDTLNTPARHYSFSYANRLRREAGQN